MLANARKYAEQLNNKLMDTWYDPTYQFYYSGRTHNTVSFEEDDARSRQFVSIDPKAPQGEEVIGYLNCWINSEINSVDGLGAINFDLSLHGKYILGRDLLQMIDDLFMRDEFNRIQFLVVVGNPIEAMYDKYIERYGGRIAGTFRQSHLGAKGELRDEKVYEIMRNEYLAHKLKER